jgi:hypothetical protein
MNLYCSILKGSRMKDSRGLLVGFVEVGGLLGCRVSFLSFQMRALEPTGYRHKNSNKQ